MAWDQLEAMGAGGKSCIALALCKTKTKQNKTNKREEKNKKEIPFQRWIFLWVQVSLLEYTSAFLTWPWHMDWRALESKIA